MAVSLLQYGTRTSTRTVRVLIWFSSTVRVRVLVYATTVYCEGDAVGYDSRAYGTVVIPQGYSTLLMIATAYE